MKNLKTLFAVTLLVILLTGCYGIPPERNYIGMTKAEVAEHLEKNAFRDRLSGNTFKIEVLQRQMYSGKGCAWVSEYGGLQWSEGDREDAWGYGNAPKTYEEFVERYKGLTDALLDNYKMFGFCYTQLYDIEQEQNGLYTYDREKKFNDEIYQRIIDINTKVAEIEK